jgi:hypothetical protein
VVERKHEYFEAVRKLELEGLGSGPLRMDDVDFVGLGTEWISEPGLHMGIEKRTLNLKEGELLDHDSIVFLVHVQ